MKNLLLCLLSAALVIGADALIKKASATGTLARTLVSPPMAASYLMYFVQIVFAVWIFQSNGGLAVYTNLFVVFYSIFGVAFGVLMFGESLSVTQMVGIGFAMVGAYLINS